jgi:hypothetical protein
MKISELIILLQDTLKVYGDWPVIVDGTACKTLVVDTEYSLVELS